MDNQSNTEGNNSNNRHNGKRSRRHSAVAAVLHILFTVLSLAVSILLTIALVLCLLQATVFNGSFFRQQIDKSNYEVFLREELVDTLAAYGADGGFGASVFRAAVSDDVLRADIYRQVSLIYDASGKGIDTEATTENFRAALYAAAGNGGELTDEQKSAADALADKATVTYVGMVSIPFVDQIHEILQQVKDTNGVGIAGFSSIILGCLLVLLFAGKHRVSRRRRAEYLMNAVAGAALILGVPSVYLYSSGWLKKIPITDQALYALSQQYIYSVMQVIVLFIGIMAAVFVCCFLYRRAYISSRKNGHRFTLLMHM
jgi:hypothetical protein